VIKFKEWWYERWPLPPSEVEESIWNAAQMDRWHKYPEEKPHKEGSYLISTNTEVYIDTWWDNYWVDTDEPVIAWMELPEPYKEGK